MRRSAYQLQILAWRINQENRIKLMLANAKGLTHTEPQAEPELPAELQILHRSNVGRVYTYIVRGKREEILQRMQMTEPLLLEAIPLTLEEIFIYEMGGEDYAVRDIVL